MQATAGGVPFPTAGGGPPHRPGGTGACLGSSCCEAEKPISSTSWAFVGQGHGGYEKMAAYNYVGAGRGSYEKEMVTSPYGWRIRKCCLCVLGNIPVCLLGGLFVTMRSDGSSTTPTTSTTAFVLATTTPAPDLPPTTELTTTSAPYNCSTGHHHSWSPGQMRWCCDVEHVGCNATTPPPPPGSQQVMDDLPPMEAGYHCDENEDFLTWNVSKRVFCCVNHQLGCPTTPPPVPPPPKPDPASPKVGCGSVCSFQGYTSSCKGHIQWAAQEWYSDKANACLTSFGLLLQHCPVCNGCTLEEAQCHQPTKPPTTPPPAQQTQAAAPTAVPPAAPAGNASAGATPANATAENATPGKGELFACDPAAPDVESWTISHRVYCCKEKEVACPKPPGAANTAQQTGSHAPASGPEHQTTTTSAYEYNCESSFSKWQQAWSTKKKAWCCQNQGLGCGEDGLAAAPAPAPAAGPGLQHAKA